MNTERLFTVANEITSDINNSGVLERLAELSQALTGQISTPNEQNVALIEQLLTTLQELKSGDWFRYPETWNSALEQIGASDLQSATFIDQVTQSVKGNSITLESAKLSVTSTHESLEKINNALVEILSAFNTLNVQGYELANGAAELSILIPRHASDNTVKSFANDISVISRFLELAEEMSTGSRTPPTLDELSTTDPLVIAGVSVSACLFVLKIVQEIIKTISLTYGLREARAKALSAEASQKTLESIDNDIEKKIEVGLKKIVSDIIKQYKSELRGRTPELRTELSHALPQIAARIDNGYKIEGAAGADSNPDAESDQNSKAEQVNSISEEISYSKLPHIPVLQIEINIKSDDTSKTKS